MNSRLRLLLASVVFALLAGVVLGGPGVAAATPSKGTGGWYWPTGTEKLGSMSGYWKHRTYNNSWHLAKDIASPQGHPVYAIADGVIAESKGEAGYGGVLVIWHRTGDGLRFLTVYGHIVRAKGTAKGAKVSAGQIIGRINSADHVHFGIHPGDAYPPDRNPFRGHTYLKTTTYGWVDPVKFLKGHLAYQLPYCAPPLPLVATISTVSTPTVLGAADGRIYWSEASADDSPTVYAQPLPSGETTRLAEDARLPELDTTRYLATVGSTSFALYDRGPVLTATFSTLKPAWGSPVSVAGTLKNAAGKPFSGAKVCLERSTDGKKWTTAATATTNLAGTFALGYAPSRCYTMRVRFAPPGTYLSATSTLVTITPKPGLHAPDAARQSKAGHRITLGGTLEARHPAGASNVVLRIQQLGAAGWVDVARPTTTNADGPTGTTHYTAKYTLPVGTWRVSASCNADALHAAESTGWRRFKVK